MHCLIYRLNYKHGFGRSSTMLSPLKQYTLLLVLCVANLSSIHALYCLYIPNYNVNLQQNLNKNKTFKQFSKKKKQKQTISVNIIRIFSQNKARSSHIRSHNQLRTSWSCLQYTTPFKHSNKKNRNLNLNFTSEIPPAFGKPRQSGTSTPIAFICRSRRKSADRLAADIALV